MRLLARYATALAVSMVMFIVLQAIMILTRLNGSSALTLGALIGAFFLLGLIHILGISFDAPLAKFTSRKWIGLGIAYSGGWLLMVAANGTSAEPAKIIWSAGTLLFVFVITFIVSTGAADRISKRFSDKEDADTP